MTRSSVIVVGSGPAGVSVCRPLIDHGVTVTMINAAKDGVDPPIQRPPLSKLRAGEADASLSFLGQDFRGLRDVGEASPKMRILSAPSAMADYQRFNTIETSGFVANGQLSSAGMSNLWGAVAPLIR